MIPFSFQKEHKIGKCEDAEPVAEPHYSIVCDGLGGAGLTVHTDPKGNKHTSAYLGSRIVRDCVLDFFSKAGDSSIGDSSIKDYVSLNLEKLRDNIKSKLKEEMEKLEPKPNRSKTIKIFPTTLASAVYSYSETKNKILAVWAGDSRVYMLNRQGLHLLSKDDLDEAEQMNCDGAMNNCISAGEEFHLNYSLYSIDGPCIVFCCSDGCFREELFKSPLHFEVSLLETIANLPEVENEKLGTVLADNLKSIYKSIIDDTTMSGVIMGINSVRDMADFAKARLKDINTPALNIHKIITEKKELQRKKDEAKKALVLSEKKLTVVRNEIDQLLETEGEKKNPAMYEFVKKISSYRQYEAQKKTDVREREQYYHKLKEEAKKEEAECLDYFLCDYVIHKKNSLWETFKNDCCNSFKLVKNDDYDLYIGNIVILKEMIKLPSFDKLFKLKDYGDFKKNLTDLINKILHFWNSEDEFFRDLWHHAYAKTEYCAREMEEYREDGNEALEVFLDGDELPKYLCLSTVCRIKEYRNTLVNIQSKLKKFDDDVIKKRKKFRETLISEIITKTKTETDDNIGTYFKKEIADVIITYIHGHKNLDSLDEEIKKKNKEIDEIWQVYKKDYLFFKKTDVKGEK